MELWSVNTIRNFETGACYYKIFTTSTRNLLQELDNANVNLSLETKQWETL